jgi:uncharacterized membrane protein
LVPSAQARVRAEIEAHFAEAVQSHLANGLFASAAQAAAVADLGDPHAAAQRFRREHLTIGEAKAVGARLNAARRTGLLFYALLIVLLSSTLVSLLQITEWAFAPALDARFLFLPATILMLVLICAGLGLAADVLGHRQPTLATTRRIFLIWTIMGLIQQILTITILPATLIRVWLFRELPYEDLMIKVGCGMSILGALLSIAPTVLLNFRLHRKLASAREDDLPPRQSA